MAVHCSCTHGTTTADCLHGKRVGVGGGGCGWLIMVGGGGGGGGGGGAAGGGGGGGGEWGLTE